MIIGTETHLDDRVHVIVDFGFPRCGRGIGRGDRSDWSLGVAERGIKGGGLDARVHGVFTGRDRGCIASEGLENTVSRCDEDVNDAFGSLRGSRDVRTHRKRRISGGHRCRGKLNIRTEADTTDARRRRTFADARPGTTF